MNKGLSKLHYSTDNFFSRKPLNYETYIKRLNIFGKFYSSPSPLLLIDCIKASRLLQLQNSKTKTNIIVNNDFLKLRLNRSNFDIESTLWNFLNKYRKSFISHESIIKTYVLTNPRPTNINQLFEIVIDNFKYTISNNNVDKSIVKTVLNILLNNKDYYNSFKLIDSTYNSPQYFSYSRRQLFKYLSSIGMINLCITGLEYNFLPLVPIVFWSCLNIGITSTLCWGYMKINLVKHLGRISWRPYNSVLYNFEHQDEILAVNKIITHFEQHNEVNIRNFHHSKVRTISNLNIFEQNDYIIELPDSNQLAAYDSSSNEDAEILKIQQFFRQELRKRKMVLNDLAEELIFLEFWLTHGENFEWVEPDQDPAEIIKFNINHNHPR